MLAKTATHKYSFKLNNYSMITNNMYVLVSYLLKHPNTHGYNVNELARNTSISVGSAHQNLIELHKQHIVTKTAISNATHYNLDFSQPQTTTMCELVLYRQQQTLNKHAQLYANELKELKNAEILILFGSILHTTQYNDVDVLCVTQHPREVLAFCKELANTRTTPINPLIMNEEELKEHIQQEHEATRAILQEGIVIRGVGKYVQVIKDAQT
jgi:predicted nucleotidyltransferase